MVSKIKNEHFTTGPEYHSYSSTQQPSDNNMLKKNSKLYYTQAVCSLK